MASRQDLGAARRRAAGVPIPRLGDDADFAALVEAAHARGLRIVLDGVFNHVGPEFDAPASWFRTGDDGERATFEGHPGLLALDHDEPAVADHVVAVMNHWLAAGADGWRLDAAYAVAPEFWAAVLPRVKAEHPDAYVVGEVIHGDYAQLVAASGMDSVTQYELWKAVWSSISDGNLFELAHALQRHADLLAAFVPMTFVGNHDVTRIASTLPDERHLPHALALLCTVGGTPSVYYGDEQAFRGVKEERVGGDDAVRPEFPEDGPGALSPLGEGTFHRHQELIGLRRRHPWLHRARTEALHLSNTWAVFASTAGDNRLVLALNLDDAPGEHDVPGVGEVLAGEAHLEGTHVTVPPHGWAVLA